MSLSLRQFASQLYYCLGYILRDTCINIHTNLLIYTNISVENSKTACVDMAQSNDFFSWSFWFVNKQDHHQQKLSALSQIALWVRVLKEAVFKDTKMKRMKLLLIHIGLNIVIVCFENSSKFFICNDSSRVPNHIGTADHVAVSLIAQQLLSCKTEVPAAYNIQLPVS